MFFCDMDGFLITSEFQSLIRKEQGIEFVIGRIRASADSENSATAAPIALATLAYSGTIRSAWSFSATGGIQASAGPPTATRGFSK